MTNRQGLATILVWICKWNMIANKFLKITTYWLPYSTFLESLYDFLRTCKISPERTTLFCKSPKPHKIIKNKRNKTKQNKTKQNKKQSKTKTQLCDDNIIKKIKNVELIRDDEWNAGRLKVCLFLENSQEKHFDEEFLAKCVLVFAKL